MKYLSLILRTTPTVCGLLVLTVAGIGCNPPKQGPTPPPGTPAKITIVGGDSIAWGRVPPGVLKYDLKIVNTGGDTLRITDVHPGCGCTTAPLEKKVLGPGDTSIVKVSLDASTRTGDLHKTLTISSNDSSRKILVLPLTAFVVREVELSPEYFPVIDTGKVGVEKTTSVMVKNVGTVAVTLQPPTFESTPEMLIHFDLTAPHVIAPGDSMRLTAFVKPIREGTASATALVATDNKNTPQLKATITCNVRDGR